MPLSALTVKSMYVNAFMLVNMSGMVPVNPVCCNVREVNAVKLPRDEGSVPLKDFPNKSTRVTCG